MGVLTGDHMQEEREATIAAFRAGTSTLLVATDVAARGLDVPGIARVICFDFPSAAAHLHRVGRTGRAGAAGVADLLFTRKEARHAARAARGKVPPCRSSASVVPQLRCYSSLPLPAAGADPAGSWPRLHSGPQGRLRRGREAPP